MSRIFCEWRQYGRGVACRDEFGLSFPQQMIYPFGKMNTESDQEPSAKMSSSRTMRTIISEMASTAWFRYGLLLPLLALFWFATNNAYERGKEHGRNKTISIFAKPYLEIVPYDGHNSQIIMIRQSFIDGTMKDLVRIKRDAHPGIEVTRLSESSLGHFGFIESISLWEVRNTTGAMIEVKENLFTNLPDGFTLKSLYYNRSTIEIKP